MNRGRIALLLSIAALPAIVPWGMLLPEIGVRGASNSTLILLFALPVVLALAALVTGFTARRTTAGKASIGIACLDLVVLIVAMAAMTSVIRAMYEDLA